MKDLLHKIGFWFLIVFIAGMIVGGYGIHRFQKWQIDQAIKLGGFINESTIYNVERRL
jgi:hypothetical protein